MDRDTEELVRRATKGDVHSFVELTRRFQKVAFGSALALLRDFQRAEDATQEAFVAAWTGLPALADPAAFPGWLRGIVRHHAFRVLRRQQLQMLPLSEAEELASDEPAPDRRIEQQQQIAAAMAAIADLPPLQREPATLFYVHDCSQQDIATFLGLSVATVNNRLHAARSHLKEKMLAMTPGMMQAHALPDDFANRVGRLAEARGRIVEILFDPAHLPDVLTELAVSDERDRSAIAVQVIQRPGGGIVRGISTTAVTAVPRGATVLSSGRQCETPVDLAGFEQVVPLLAGRGVGIHQGVKLLETGIKVIDVMCPLIAGGSVVIAGEVKTGISVVTEELVRRLSGGTAPLSLFSLIPRWPDAPQGWSLSEQMKTDGFSEGTVGAVQTFFFRSGDGSWVADQLPGLASADAVIHLTSDMIRAKIYPAVDVMTSRSRCLEAMVLDDEHATIVERVRDAIAALRATEPQPASGAGSVDLDRARKLQNFFGQPFFVAEPYTKRPGSHVSRDEALRGCREILDGVHDDLPVDAFYWSGSIAEIRNGNVKKAG
ncbi:MAG TPA: sigma-70 family RNA polymerase sigma factor [Xanthobacteraceae bacterium]|jgi:RNA polymerase sigma factor (sigma-70 family)